jgi:hypothetical protein
LKRFVYNVLLFSLLATCVVALLTALLGGNGRLRNVKYHLGVGDYSAWRLREAGKTHDVDVLFIGSSHAYRTFDPRFYAEKGLSVFNLGSSNQTPLQTEMLLRTYLDNLNPRLVVMEVHPDVMCLDGVESSIFLANHMGPSFEVARMAFAVGNVKSVLSMVYSASHNSFSSELSHFEESTADTANIYISGGYVERVGGTYSPCPHPTSTLDFSARQMRSLRAIVRLLKRRGVPCLLVEVPDTKVLRESYENYDQFVTQMEMMGDFRPLRLDALDDSLHFYNDNHLNQAGVDLLEVYFYDSVLYPYMQEKQIR